MPRHVRKGDTVVVTSGKDRGKAGEVLHVYPDDDRVLVGGPGNPGGYPLGEYLVLRPVDLQPYPALVGNRPGRLGKDQAAARIREYHPAASSLAGEVGIICLQVKSKERQAEPVLAGLGTMTGTAVTTGLGKHRLDVVPETPLE